MILWTCRVIPGVAERYNNGGEDGDRERDERRTHPVREEGMTREEEMIATQRARWWYGGTTMRDEKRNER